MRPTTVEAVLERVTPEPNTGCLLWIGAVDVDGYGLTRVRGRQFRAHRLAWEQVYGPVPAGALICHRCDQPSCVNPAHLFAGSHRDNMADRAAKDRQLACGVRGEAHYNHLRPAFLRVRGERHGRRKLSEVQAREIIARLHAGETQHGLARSFGVSVGTVNLIALGRNWAHLARP